MLENRKVVTIDGLAGTGKSTISSKLAKKSGFILFSSGLLYRTTAYLALSANVDPSDGAAVAKVLKENTLLLDLDEKNRAIVLLNGERVAADLYKPAISEATSIASAHPEVRALLLKPQHDAFPGRDIIAEGRDMGSVVFPDADMKFFIEVDEPIKVKRRIEQMCAGKTLSEDELNQLKKDMKKEISERDARDASRSHCPAVCQPDMELINNSSEPLENVVQNMYNLLVAKGIIRS